MHQAVYMKTIFVSVILIVMSGLAVFGQGASSGPATTSKKADDFPREQFDIGGEWCGWCRYMDKFFYQNAELARTRDENFVWVKINFSEENENQPFLSAYPAITGYPHLFVLGGDGSLLRSQPTDELEQGEGYNLQKFAEFLKTWSPKKEVVNK